MIDFGAIRGTGASSRYAREATAPKTSSCREIVAVTPAKQPESRNPQTGQRANAPFVAHLIATSEGLPQTRERRRADPAEAAASYGRSHALREVPGSLLRTM